MVPTRLRIVVAAVLVAAITVASALGWVLTCAGRLDRTPSTATPVAASTSAAR